MHQRIVFLLSKRNEKKYKKPEIILHRTVADPSRKRSTTDIPSEEAMSPTSKSRWNITANKKILYFKLKNNVVTKNLNINAIYIIYLMRQ